jgi:hypothetical protein
VLPALIPAHITIPEEYACFVPLWKEISEGKAASTAEHGLSRRGPQCSRKKQLPEDRTAVGFEWAVLDREGTVFRPSDFSENAGHGRPD